MSFLFVFSLYRWPSLVEEKGILDVFRLGQGAWNPPTLRKGALPPVLEIGPGTLRRRGREEDSILALTGLWEEQRF